MNALIPDERIERRIYLIRGMKVILDFVPNHTGWDSRWMLRHPEWFRKDAAGNIISPVKEENGESWGWDDVAQLDYSVKRLRENVIQAHEFWMNASS